MEEGGGLSPRQFCNVVYAHLVDGADREARDEFDKELHAPAGGWANLERRLFSLIEEAG